MSSCLLNLFWHLHMFYFFGKHDYINFKVFTAIKLIFWQNVPEKHGFFLCCASFFWLRLVDNCHFLCVGGPHYRSAHIKKIRLDRKILININVTSFQPSFSFADSKLCSCQRAPSTVITELLITAELWWMLDVSSSKFLTAQQEKQQF